MIVISPSFELFKIIKATVPFFIKKVNNLFFGSVVALAVFALFFCGSILYYANKIDLI